MPRMVQEPQRPQGVEESPCLSCTFCAMYHPVVRFPDSRCTPWMDRPQDPRNPPEYRWEKTPFRLYNILRVITPKDLWKSWLKALNLRGLGGYRKETHYRPRLKKCPKAKETRLSTPKPPWGWIRRRVERAVNLETPAPRITTVAYHGPRALLRPFFPEFPEDPNVSISPEKAHELLTKERAMRLAGVKNLALGGHGKGSTIPELEALETPEIPKSLEELEPLRAMSLREVTNLQFLRDYTEVQKREETPEAQEDEDG